MVRRLGLILAMSAAAGALSIAVDAQVTGFFVPDWTFRASDLNGTRQVGQATWRVENGEIVGTPSSPDGGWLLLQTGYQDVHFAASFRCANPCSGGVMVRSERSAAGGLQGIYASIGSGEAMTGAVAVDPQGRIGNRVPFTRAAGGQIRIAPPPPPPAPAGEGGRGGRGGGRAGGEGGGGGRGGAPASTFTSMFPPAPSAAFRPNEWNTVQVLIDANIVQAGMNQGARLNPVAVDAETGSFGPIALHVAGTNEIRFKDLALKDLQPRTTPPVQSSPRFRVQHFEEHYYGWSAAAGDFNNDKVLDVTIANRYYLGPDFTVSREIYLAQAFSPATQYGPAMVNFAHDFTRDGWDDVLVAESRTPVLYVNPKGESRRWTRHEVFPAVSSEAIVFRDINNDGTPDAVFAGGGVAQWVTVDPANPTGPWKVYRVSDQGPASSSNHGIGAGDINADGRVDILMPHGWWEQPAAGPTETPWRFHQAAFGRNGNAGGEMVVLDANGDKLPDVVTALEAHSFGLAWYEQRRDASGAISWVQHLIMDNFATKNAGGVTFTELHAMTSADVTGDGVPDVITGKRHWAHRDSYADPDPHGPGVLYLYRTVRNPKAPGGAEFVPELIHNRSGVGSMIQTADLNRDGLVDILAGTTFGGHIFWGVKR